MPTDYPSLLAKIKQRIRTAQVRAALSANAELIRLYWDIGRVIEARQRQEGWGRAVIPRLAHDLHNEMPEVKGFSERNIGRMIAFYREYPHGEPISPQPVAQLPSPLGTGRAGAAQGDQAIRPILPQAVAKLPADQWAAMV